MKGNTIMELLKIEDLYVNAGEKEILKGINLKKGKSM